MVGGTVEHIWECVCMSVVFENKTVFVLNCFYIAMTLNTGFST